jgi:diguanylate cyclase (GGDEF)-like protein/PAS domain S-box-containing protein
MLKEIHSDSKDMKLIETVENTLDEYFGKLSIIQNAPSDITTNELDEIVKVSDEKANLALIKLRTNILPRLIKQQEITQNKVNELNDKTVLISIILIPIILFSNLLTIRFIKRIEGTSKELETIFNVSPDGILYIDKNGGILRTNKMAEKIFGYKANEFINLSVEELVPDNIKEQHLSLRREFSQKTQSKEMGNRDSQIQGVRKDGSLVDLNVSIAAEVFDGTIKSVCIVKYISLQNELEFVADTDHLTSVSNRRSFDKTLKEELARNSRENKTLALLIIDLDNFKLLNDKSGHTSGDAALKKVAEYLQCNSRPYDHLARWGGDEFVLLCSNMSVSDATNCAEKLCSGFNSISFPWEQKLTLSIGVSSTNNLNPLSAEDFLDAADKALYAAKKNGRNQAKHFDLL